MKFTSSKILLHVHTEPFKNVVLGKDPLVLIKVLRIKFFM